ncbi:ABC transporter ATP-binding protein [Pyrodictium abyssi]|uniref:ABC transporter ATP-binding protein n=1 Tax=Pyrodictium abyssi TaxID=54256 RepID=A0ABN6ZSC0_9CREN|nr:ABC transporter ATP-binding protein [Pyrodictium abyssi]
MPSGKPVLELVNVSKAYRAGETITWGLRGLSLRVHRGEFIAIMGPSGSGKTTLLNMAGLLDRPTRGKIYIDGFDVSRLSDRQLARLRNRYIGFVFQQFNLINRLTVLENIELPLIPRGVPRRERRRRAVRALLSVGGDPSWLPKKPLQLSGGQQQRVAIARAIVGEPHILLADEPTGALDRRTARLVVETFIRLNEHGQTILVVTHDPEVANCAHRIYQIRDGRIAGVEEPDNSKCILNTVM